MSAEPRPTVRGRGVDFYLEKIRLLGWVEFDYIDVVSTAGDIRPPYPFQFFAYTKRRPGEDDPFEGKGASLFEAVRNLYANLIKDYDEDLETP